MRLFVTLFIGAIATLAAAQGSSPSQADHHSSAASVTGHSKSKAPAASPPHKNSTTSAGSKEPPPAAGSKEPAPVATVTETLALSLVLDILDMSVRVIAPSSSPTKKGGSEKMHSSSAKESSVSSHACANTPPAIAPCCGIPATVTGVTTTTATVTSTVSQGFILATTSTARSFSVPTSVILSATSSSG